jgi:hypothetical protein
MNMNIPPHGNGTGSPDDEDDDLHDQRVRETPPFGRVCKAAMAAFTELAIP